ncbi:MAG: PIG-L family deacetylase [Chitinophagaceae bacterium]|nr:PIG-L family deacetylase [Chitinophagaceae bacterium]MDP3667444.1 PIG-L deacetylase family protein [Sediminibacterium sp.]
MKKRVLIVAPHPDDETLGAGGTAAKFISQGHEVSVLIISGHLPPLYKYEAYEKTVNEAEMAFKIIGISSYKFLELPATLIGNEPVHILNKKISDVMEEISPNIVLCCYPDRHIDHRVVFDSVMVATRPIGFGKNIEILAAYETLSETHWNAAHIEPNFMPNWVVDISEFMDKKLKALNCYKSQIPEFPGSRSIQAVEALAKFRGTQAGFAFGEAFQIIRMKS